MPFLVIKLILSSFDFENKKLVILSETGKFICPEIKLNIKKIKNENIFFTMPS